MTAPAGSDPAGSDPVDLDPVDSDGTGGVGPTEGARWELLRALGAVALVGPPQSDPLAAALDLAPWTRAEHTRMFVLGLPPYASIHLGAEGKLGGEGADRVAGVWRVLGLTPPADADHLGTILALYSELGEASVGARTPAARRTLDRTRTVVLWEHLWAWTPQYLRALRVSEPAAGPWAGLLMRALAREARLSDGAELLPLALRTAPAAIDVDLPYPELLDALVAPLRVGFVVTHQDLADATGDLGAGLRRGERRFILDALLRQQPAGVLAWLARHARRHEACHRALRVVPADPGPWWAERAATTATVLDRLAASAH